MEQGKVRGKELAMGKRVKRVGGELGVVTKALIKNHGWVNLDGELIMDYDGF